MLRAYHHTGKNQARDINYVKTARFSNFFLTLIWAKLPALFGLIRPKNGAQVMLTPNVKTNDTLINVSVG